MDISPFVLKRGIGKDKIIKRIVQEKMQLLSVIALEDATLQSEVSTPPETLFFSLGCGDLKFKVCGWTEGQPRIWLRRLGSERKKELLLSAEEE